MFKFIFELATEPLGLPIEWYYEYMILAVIGVVAYKLSYDKVGDFYDSGLISGSVIGSFFHWLIRLIWFAIIWAITYFAIVAGKFVISNWQIIAMILGSILGTGIICTLAIIIMRNAKKKRAVSNNG